MLSSSFNGRALSVAISEYESGQMDEDETREFLEFLAETGVLEHLQGSYMRAYLAMIQTDET